MRDLLKLQKHDLERIQAEKQLATIPKERDSLNQKINAVKGEIEALSNDFKEMELKRNQLDTELKSVEDKIVKYKTQQMEVKKNEEYATLGQQIEDSKAEVSCIEDEELALMLAIDEKTETNKVAIATHHERIAQIEGEISVIDKQETEFKANLEDLLKAVEDSKSKVDKAYLAKYEQVMPNSRKGPYVVALEGLRCSGCHLTVSNELASEVKVAQTIVLCDNCSRILYKADI